MFSQGTEKVDPQYALQMSMMQLVPQILVLDIQLNFDNYPYGCSHHLLESDDSLEMVPVDVSC